MRVTKNPARRPGNASQPRPHLLGRGLLRCARDTGPSPVISVTREPSDDQASCRFDQAGEGEQVLPDVELRLIFQHQGAGGRERNGTQIVHPLHRQPGAAARLHLGVQLLDCPPYPRRRSWIAFPDRSRSHASRTARGRTRDQRAATRHRGGQRRRRSCSRAVNRGSRVPRSPWRSCIPRPRQRSGRPPPPPPRGRLLRGAEAVVSPTIPPPTIATSAVVSAASGSRSAPSADASQYDTRSALPASPRPFSISMQ